MIRLKELRNKLSLTQEIVSRELGVQRPTYARYETGERQPDYETLIKISEYFNVSIDYLLGKENAENEDENNVDFEKKLIKAYKSHPEHQASINALLGISPADNVTKLQSDTKPAFVAAASGNEYKANEPDATTLIEIEKLQKKHNK